MVVDKGINADGAAAKIMSFIGLGEKSTPWHFWEDNSRVTGVPERSPCKKTCKLQ